MDEVRECLRVFFCTCVKVFIHVCVFLCAVLQFLKTKKNGAKKEKQEVRRGGDAEVNQANHHFDLKNTLIMFSHE